MTAGRKTLVAAGVVSAILAVILGTTWVPRLLTWRELDRSYAEEFSPPATLAPSLAGRHLLFHMKTGLAQDDSQICVGFNIILAALESGAQVKVLFDAGALLDLKGEDPRLARTGVPERLRKAIAAQMHRPVEEMPLDYGAYLEHLDARGAEVFANTAMLVVTGDASRVQTRIPAYPFIEPAPYARVAQLIVEADRVIVY